MEWLIVAGVVMAVLVLAVPALMQVQERADTRQALARIDGYHVEGARTTNASLPLVERTMEPVRERAIALANKYTPVGYIDKVRRKLVLAGSPKRLDLDEFLLFKALGTVSGLLWAAITFAGLGLSGGVGVVSFALLWLIAFMLPDVLLARRIETRQHDIRRQLPELLDLLTISVEAGLGFDQAVERTSAAVPGALSDEFRRMLQETRIGASRAVALRALDERTDVSELRAFILAMLQADTFGVSIAQVLRAQADEMRVRRRVAAQELGQKAPVKMLPPLVFCIFPSFLLVILGPAAISIFKSFSH